MNKIKILFSIILAFTFYNCSSYKINYNRDKIINKYSDNYIVLLDNEKIQLENIYLDKDNIKNIIVDKKSKVINISQNKINELFELKNINLLLSYLLQSYFFSIFINIYVSRVCLR